jgi:hypothetical protein
VRPLILAIVAAVSGCSSDKLDQVRAQFKDPGSVQFKDAKVFSWSDTVSKGSAVCGQINAKNSYGAYAGFSYFIASGYKLDVKVAEDASMAARMRDCCAEIERASRRGVSPAFVASAHQACVGVADF